MNSRDDITDINANPQSALDSTQPDNKLFHNGSFNNENFDMASIDITAATDTAQLPQPIQPPIQQATYKAHATDFIVNELLPLEFTGEGEHLWLHIQKSGMNTAYLAKLLSEWAEIPLRDVGYSGLKDRHALTTQWFSLRIPKKQLPTSEFAPVDIGADELVTILDQQWHNKKLNRGTHRANQFVITLRDIQFADFDTALPVPEQLLTAKQDVERHLESIATTGLVLSALDEMAIILEKHYHCLRAHHNKVDHNPKRVNASTRHVSKTQWSCLPLAA